MNEKQLLLERFARIFGSKAKLFCIHLDGFSHEVFYKDDKGNRHIDMYSSYLSECEKRDEELFEDKIYRSSNSDKVKALFIGISNFYHQNNAVEYCYRDIKEWRLA